MVGSNQPPVKPNIPGLTMEGNRIVGVQPKPSVQPKTLTPLYNPSIHKVGDKVLIRHRGRLVETVIPELDADGQPI